MIPARPEPTPVEQFKRWLHTDDPDAPATRVYWTGRLAEDASGSREVRELSAAALYASGAVPPSRRTTTEDA